MRRFFGIVVVLTLAACAPEASTTTSTATDPTTSLVAATTSSGPDRMAAWNEDLDVLVERLELVHPDPYWRVGEEEFAPWQIGPTL